MSQREASTAYGIPKTTLVDKIRGSSLPTVMNRGTQPVLNKELEDR